mmetsp:Transcript_20207/g.63498  ORF Transcript_20207/g.63498 Transcript_20207/m.63498 type:complete len:271 (-) Transcript_20207:17-829(-)
MPRILRAPSRSFVAGRSVRSRPMLTLLSLLSRLMRHLMAGHTIGRRSSDSSRGLRLPLLQEAAVSSDPRLRMEEDAELRKRLELLRVDTDDEPGASFQGLGLSSQTFVSSGLLLARLSARLRRADAWSASCSSGQWCAFSSSTSGRGSRGVGTTRGPSAGRTGLAWPSTSSSRVLLANWLGTSSNSSVAGASAHQVLSSPGNGSGPVITNSPESVLSTVDKCWDFSSSMPQPTQRMKARRRWLDMLECGDGRAASLSTPQRLSGCTLLRK